MIVYSCLMLLQGREERMGSWRSFMKNGPKMRKRAWPASHCDEWIMHDWYRLRIAAKQRRKMFHAAISNSAHSSPKNIPDAHGLCWIQIPLKGFFSTVTDIALLCTRNSPLHVVKECLVINHTLCSTSEWFPLRWICIEPMEFLSKETHSLFV